MNELLLLGIAAALINNLVLVQFLGVSPLLCGSKNLKSAAQMGLAVIIVMTCASILTWAVGFVLTLFRLEYLKILAFVMVTAAFVQLLGLFLYKKLPKLNEKFTVHLSILTANSAILGITLMSAEQFGREITGGFTNTVVSGIAASIGFFIAIILLAGIRERLELSDVPQSFRGIPIALISIALISIAFMGVL